MRRWVEHRLYVLDRVTGDPFWGRVFAGVLVAVLAALLIYRGYVQPRVGARPPDRVPAAGPGVQ
ncbi:hypothetical protein GobsT_31150 [Gemmata obscuriglobus]|uniref:Uncharacterized protein n=1 Tax=Gemmata obscuriglobus TaxID=114 RepID=A0A2Z3H549_9BACT|nr:hypothetical protein [Gemmata obscuriglobus]AWM38696.1 hypothetical protein C1280_18015 [Gemmata obscuriglobus]QEG28338.1 hypothetical protein GobsT_31150 [Gemmata obscuriglobus]VTS06213.1 unnamed protein product [Gemmata obscuriglobus UQM 2246]